MVWYSDGTISSTVGTTLIVGVGVNFIAANVKQGDALIVNNLRLEIASVLDETSLHLINVWSGTILSSATYHIEPIGIGHTTNGAIVETLREHIALQKLRTKNAVLDDTLNTPPSNPDIGDRYIVKAGGTGFWSSHDEQYATWSGTQWIFHLPAGLFGGSMVWVEATQKFCIYTNSGWKEYVSPVDDTLTRTLISEIASIKWETGTTRDFEFGLIGGEDLELKASSQTEASIIIDRDTGNVKFPYNNISNNNYTNILVDSGRFTTTNVSDILIGAYAPQVYMGAYSGAVLAGYIKQVYNSTSNTNSYLVALQNKLNFSTYQKIYFAEFWIQSITYNSPTLALATLINSKLLPEIYTAGIYMHAVNNSTTIFKYAGVKLFIDGVEQNSDYILQPSQGWVLVTYIFRGNFSTFYSYTYYLFAIKGIIGGSSLHALPFVVRGIHDVANMEIKAFLFNGGI